MSRFKWLILVWLIVMLGLYYTTQIRISHYATTTLDNGTRYEDPLFTRFAEGKAGRLATEFTLEIPAGAAPQFALKVQGCLESLTVNGEVVDWRRMLRREEWCNEDKALRLGLENVLHAGSNHVQAESSRQGVYGGVTPYPAPQSFFFILFHAFLGLGLVLIATRVWSVALGQAWHWQNRELHFVALTVSAALIYGVSTGWDVRTHDVYGHLEYIRRVFEYWRIPHPEDCWECYQVPGYYFLSAGILKVSQLFLSSLYSAVFLLQLISLACMFLLLLGIRLVWRLLNDRDSFPLAALALVVSTPSFFIHSARIGNDLPFYVAAIFFLYFLQKFWLELKLADLQKCLGLLVLAFLFKLSALGLLGSVLFVLLFSLPRLSTRPAIEKFKIIACVLLTYMVIITIFRHRNLLYGDVRVFQYNQYNATLAIEPHWWNYVMFNLKTFFTQHPAVQPWSEIADKEIFWNYFLKSFFNGEFRINNELNIYIAHLRNLLMLVLLVISLRNWKYALFANHRAWPVFLFVISLIFALICYQYAHPISPSVDARLIYPVCVGLLALQWRSTRWSRALVWACVCLGSFFWLNFFLIQNY